MQLGEEHANLIQTVRGTGRAPRGCRIARSDGSRRGKLDRHPARTRRGTTWRPVYTLAALRPSTATSPRVGQRRSAQPRRDGGTTGARSLPVSSARCGAAERPRRQPAGLGQEEAPPAQAQALRRPAAERVAHAPALPVSRARDALCTKEERRRRRHRRPRETHQKPALTGNTKNKILKFLCIIPRSQRRCPGAQS